MSHPPQLPLETLRLRRRRFERYLVLGIGVLLVFAGLLGCGAWYLTTDSGVRRFVLPWISQQIGLDVRAERAIWHPLSSLQLEGLQIGTAKTPLLSAVRLSVDYQGLELWNHRFLVDRIILDSPEFHFVQTKNSAFSSSSSDKAPPSPSPSSRKMRPKFTYSIASLKINNMNWMGIDPASAWKIQGINLSASSIAPGKDMNFEGMGSFLWKPSPSHRGIRGVTKLNGNLQWTPNFDVAGGRAVLTLGSCEGMLDDKNLKNISLHIQVDLTTTSDGKSILRMASGSLEEGKSVLASWNVQGSLNLLRREADLDVTIGPVRSSGLNFLGVSSKVDFLDSSVRYIGHVALRDGGNRIHTSGRLEADPLNLTDSRLPRGVWKPIHFVTEHIVEVDRARKKVTFSKLKLDATQMGFPWIQATLDKPMSLSWSEITSPEAIDTAFINFQLFPTDLIPWQSFLNLPQDILLQSGKVSAQATLSAIDAGRTLILDGHFFTTNVALKGPSILLKNAIGSIDGTVQIKDLRKIQITPSAIRLFEGNVPLLSGTLSGDLDARSQSGSGRLEWEASLSNLFTLRPVDGLELKAGHLKGKVDWSLESGSHWICKANITTSPFDLTWKSIHYPHAEIAFQSDVSWRSPSFRLANTALHLHLDGKPAGSWAGEISGLTDMTSFESNFTLKDFHESSVAPALAYSFPQGPLRTVDLSGKARIRHRNGNYDMEATIDLKKIAFDNSSVSERSPLEARISMDLHRDRSDVLTLRSATIKWPSVGKDENLIRFSGSIAPEIADLTITSRAIDATPWYDRLFPTDKASSPSPPSFSPARPSSVSSAKILSKDIPSSRTLILNISADSLRLRNLVLTQLKIPYSNKGGIQKIDQASALIKGSPITLSFQRDSTLSKPFIRFDLSAAAMPLEPWLASFQPSLKDIVSGVLRLKIIGTASGFTWMEIGPTSNGIVELAMRNADLEKLPSIKQGLLQLGKFLDSQPIIGADIDRIDASGKIVDGRLTTENLHVGGDLVESTLRGDLTWDQKLDMEATFKAKREALKKSSLFTTSTLDQLTGKQNGWSKLPGAAKVKGTLEQPIFQFDKAKMFGDVLKNAGGNILMDILQNKKSQNTNDPKKQHEQQKSLDDLLKGLLQ